MNKKFLVLAFMSLLSFTLIGCDLFNESTTTTTTTISTTTDFDVHDLDAWLNSDLAIDLNGDRKINSEDFEMYCLQNVYSYWRLSDNALDNNGDHLINEEDFELYKLQNNYDYWKTSEVAYDYNGDSSINQSDYDIYLNYEYWRTSLLSEDLNNDSVIDIDDYELYVEFAEFVGTYTFENYVYVGEPTIAILGDDGVIILLTDLGDYITRFMFTVHSDGTTSVTIPSDIQIVFGSVFPKLIEGAENLTISRLSPYIVSIDSFITIENVEVAVTIYLTTTEGGYHATYVMGAFDGNPTMSFDIIKHS